MSDPSLSSSSQLPAGSQTIAPTQNTQSQEVPSSSSGTVPDLTTSGSANTLESAQAAELDTDPVGGDDLDATVENDISMTGADTTMAEGQTGATTAVTGADAPGNPVAGLGPPTKKESSLREFLGKMDDYAPIVRLFRSSPFPSFHKTIFDLGMGCIKDVQLIFSCQIPDAVTAHYLTVAGLPPPGNGPNQTPPHLARLLALATQKFVADIAADAYQYSRIRASNSSTANNPMGGLNAAAGLNIPGSSNPAGGAGAAGAGGDAGKGKGGAANTHLGIQRPGFGGGGQGGSGQGRTVLTMEDLGMAVSEYGVSVKRGEFYR